MLKEKVFDIPIVFDVFRNIMIGGKKNIHNVLIEKIGNNEKTILEIGCGTGDFAEPLKKYTGVDTNLLFIKKAQKKYPQKFFYYMDALKLDFKNNCFDKILIMNFLHHFKDEDCFKILEEAKRVAKEEIIVLDAFIGDTIKDKWLSYLDRGDYLRTKEEQLNLIKKIFKIEDIYSFKSGLYNFMLVKCKKEEK